MIIFLTISTIALAVLVILQEKDIASYRKSNIILLKECRNILANNDKCIELCKELHVSNCELRDELINKTNELIKIKE
jgi:hypothetical protein